MRAIVFACALAAALGACAPKAPQDANSVPVIAADIPTGDYDLDKSHASLVFRVSHLGYSIYTANFSRFDAELSLDPRNPAAAQLTARVDVASLELNSPPPGFADLIQGPEWLDAANYPEMRFQSTGIELTDEDMARVMGDLTLRGVTRPMTLDVKFNGGWAGFLPYDPRARIGFSARGDIRRSDFGMDSGLPPPGTKMGLADEIEIMIEAEFSGPLHPDAQASG